MWTKRTGLNYDQAGVTILTISSPWKGRGGMGYRSMSFGKKYEKKRRKQKKMGKKKNDNKEEI
jgi:hypothetical protein